MIPELISLAEQFRINVLTNQDILDASLAADTIFKAADIEVSMANIKAYEAEKAVQQLYRACRGLDGNPLAPTITDFRKLLTVDVKEWLIDRYNELDADLNPSLYSMSDADFDTLVEAVKKNPAATALNSLSTSTLKRLALSLASAPPSLQTGSGPTSQ